MQACGHTPIWSGERVLRTNVRGRHTYLAEFKRWIVEQAQQPGMSLAGLAMSNQVNANQLRRWVQLHGKPLEVAAAVASLLPVTVAAAPMSVAVAAAPGVAVEIEVSGALVRVHMGVDAGTLRTVLHCLRGMAT
jgi:transposase-like protein